MDCDLDLDVRPLTSLTKEEALYTYTIPLKKLPLHINDEKYVDKYSVDILSIIRWRLLLGK